MLARPPSYQKTYDDFFTGDPAIIQPPPPVGEDATEEQKAEYRKQVEEYAHKITVAKETGRIDGVVLPGQVPLKFTMGQVDRNAWRILIDRVKLPENNPQHVGSAQMLALLVRLALVNIVGWDVKVNRQADEQFGWVMCQPEIITELDETNPSIVAQLGGNIFRRLNTVSPKS